MIHTTARALVLATLMAAPRLAGAQASGAKDQHAASKPETYNFTDANGRNTVAMTLDAPFESIHGVANGVEGKATIAKNKASGQFKVRVDSIKTGNDTRDGHLQNDKWLDAKKNPFIEFSFKDLELPAAFLKGEPVTVKTTGDFTIHGVTKSQPVEVTIQRFAESDMTKKRLPGNLVRVKSKLQIKLPDYGVAQSDSAAKSLIGLKVGETADISIDFFGTDKV